MVTSALGVSTIAVAATHTTPVPLLKGDFLLSYRVTYQKAHQAPLKFTMAVGAKRNKLLITFGPPKNPRQFVVIYDGKTTASGQKGQPSFRILPGLEAAYFCRAPYNIPFMGVNLPSVTFFDEIKPHSGTPAPSPYIGGRLVETDAVDTYAQGKRSRFEYQDGAILRMDSQGRPALCGAFVHLPGEKPEDGPYDVWRFSDYTKVNGVFVARKITHELYDFSKARYKKVGDEIVMIERPPVLLQASTQYQLIPALPGGSKKQ